jgi:hypothetical protein
MKVNTFHTTTPEGSDPGHRDVYHDDSSCPDGSRILSVNRVPGTGGRPKCDWCKSH